MRRIRIFDTTLRDGEQTPGVNLNIQEKWILQNNWHVLEWMLSNRDSR